MSINRKQDIIDKIEETWKEIDLEEAKNRNEFRELFKKMSIKKLNEFLSDETLELYMLRDR